MNGWMDGWIDAWMDRQIQWMDRQVDERMIGCMNDCMEWMDDPPNEGAYEAKQNRLKR